MKLIYLDNNATTRVDPIVLKTMIPYFTEFYGNPASSTHILGWQAEAALSEAILSIARLIHAERNEIIFTSGATESNNMVLKGVGLSKKDNIIVSNIEHKCVLNTADYLSSNYGVEISTVRCDKKGLIDPYSFEQVIKTNTVLASIMLGNNEIHSINEINTISKICKEKGVLLHVDATQAVGKIEVDVKKMGVDYLSFSSHKFYGPKGVGVLFIKGRDKEHHLTPLFHGGLQQGNLRSGTLAVPLIVGIGKASEIALTYLEKKEENELRQLAKLFFNTVQNEINDVVLNGPDINDRLPGGLSMTFPNVDIGKVQFCCPNICFSRGAACSSGNLDYSYVLKAIGLSAIEAAGTARFCIGRFNEKEEIIYAAETLAKAVKSQYNK